MNSWHNGKSSDCNRGFLVYWKNRPTTGLGFCLWVPFTQIAEFCLWEPKIWSPGIPGGIFGRTAQLSSLICGWGGLWVGPQTCVGCRASTWGCMGARTLVLVWVACVDLPFFFQPLEIILLINCCKTIQLFLFPELEIILLIICWKTILLLFCFQTWT